MKWFKLVLTIIVGYIVFSMIKMPDECTSAVIDSMKLCATAVIPTLFPFFVCSSLFVNLGLARYASKFLSGIMKPVFNVDGSGAIAVILGLISGYPVGAKCAVDLYNSGRISKIEAERLIGFCNNSGPLFVVGTVGFAMNHSIKLGGILYAVHVVSALATGVILSRYKSGVEESFDPIRIENYKNIRPTNKVSAMGEIISSFSSSIFDSVLSILKICGFVVFFAVVGETIPKFWGYEFLYSFLEITGGINLISGLELDAILKFSCISAFLAFSGISVLMQVSSITYSAKISQKSYFIGKVTQALISFLLIFIIFSVMEKVGMLSSIFEYTGAFNPVNQEGNNIILTMSVKQMFIQMIAACAWCLISVLVLCFSWIIMEKFESLKLKHDKKL